MTVSSTGNGSILMSMAAQAMALKEAELQSAVSVAVLSDALDVQEELITELLQSLGIGQNVDVTV